VVRFTGFAGGAFIQTADEAEGVTVPDVVGDDEATGTAALEGAGFVVSSVNANSASVPIGDIISQDPAGGASAPDGSTVTIYVSIGPAAAGYICRPFNFNWWNS
jgi:beta-lactam-binding protein with PASTA domain